MSKRAALKLEQMLARKPHMMVTVALADKTARTLWPLPIKNENDEALSITA